MAIFEEALDHLYTWEGTTFVNDPDDPGGATKYGVTLNTWKQYGYDKDGDGDIDAEDIKVLTKSDANKVYKPKFWDKVKGDDIKHQEVAENVFDHAVNAGVWRSSKMVQMLLKTNFGKELAIDGVIGGKTVAALNSVDLDRFNALFTDLREMYYNYRANLLPESHSLVKFFKSLKVSPSNTAKKYIKGWLNRVGDFKKAISASLDQFDEKTGLSSRVIGGTLLAAITVAGLSHLYNRNQS